MPFYKIDWVKFKLNIGIIFRYEFRYLKNIKSYYKNKFFYIFLFINTFMLNFQLNIFKNFKNIFRENLRSCWNFHQLLKKLGNLFFMENNFKNQCFSKLTKDYIQILQLAYHARNIFRACFDFCGKTRMNFWNFFHSIQNKFYFIF